MKKTVCLLTLSLLMAGAQAATTSVVAQWEDFSDLTRTWEGKNMDILLNGGTSAPTINGDNHLVFNGQSGSYASMAFPEGFTPGWTSTKSYGIQLTISGLQLSNSLRQLFTYQGATPSGAAASNSGLITSGNKMNSWGNTFGSGQISDTFTLTVLQNSDAGSGTRYYINGQYVGVDTSGWRASGKTWTSLELGNAYKDNAGAEYILENLALFNVDSVNNADLDAAAKGMYDRLVPEPATASLGLLGLAALMFRRRRA